MVTFFDSRFLSFGDSLSKKTISSQPEVEAQNICRLLQRTHVPLKNRGTCPHVHHMIVAHEFLYVVFCCSTKVEAIHGLVSVAMHSVDVITRNCI